jgi:hypothetical protein
MTAPIREMPEGRAVTEVTSYTELIEAIKARIAELGIKYENFDDLAWFAPGLSGKVFGPSQVKRLGSEKLFDALRAASLKITVTADPQQFEKMRKEMDKHVQPRSGNQARYGNSASPVSAQLLSRCFKHLSREGGKKRWAKSSQKERSEHMRMMAMAGVRKRRKEMKRRAKQRKRAHAARKEAAAQSTGAPT